MTPEELARLQAGLDPRAYYPEGFGSRGATTVDPTIPLSARERAQRLAGQTLQGAQQLMGDFGALPFGRIGLVGGGIPTVSTAMSEAAAGRPVGAAGAVGGGILGGFGAAGLAQLIPAKGQIGRAHV